MTRTREENAADLAHEDATRPPKRFYVTLTWDDWPEGGSYGAVVEAEDHEEAEQMARHEMGVSRAEERDVFKCPNCEGTDAHSDATCHDCGVEMDYDGVAMAEEMGDEWHLVDCFDLDEFVEMHKKGD